MRIEFEYREGACIVRLSGRFRTGSNAELEQAVAELRRAGVGCVIVDCAEVPYLDSTGLTFLVGLHNLLVENGGMVAVCSPSERARAILRLTRLDETIPVFDGAKPGAKTVCSPALAA